MEEITSVRTETFMGSS